MFYNITTMTRQRRLEKKNCCITSYVKITTIDELLQLHALIKKIKIDTCIRYLHFYESC